VTGFLLDTNVISEPLKDQPDANVQGWFASVNPGDTYLSVLTLGEIRRGIESVPSSARKNRLELWFQDLSVRFHKRVLAVDDAVADRWGVMTSRAEGLGRTLPAVDSLIAATALEHGLTFVTRDTGELAITGVKLLNPWQS
jgi:predicted nucleic acid-binding protein